MSRLLITQALDEKELLVKKIADKTEAARFVDIKRRNEEKTADSRTTAEEFSQKAKSSFQQIKDLIARYQAIDAAIVASNAATTIETSYGTLTVAAAISLRNRLRKPYGKGDSLEFESQLEKKLFNDFNGCVSVAERKNQVLNDTAENMRISILGKESKGKEDTSLDVVDTYVKENTMEIIDPLNVMECIEESRLRRTTLLTELETQIKVSNATTFIEI